MTPALRCAALSALALTGCSLMGIGDLEVRRCVDDEQCQVFNDLQGGASSCQAFSCVDGACLRRPEGVEVADASDNDCDGLIDEPTIDGGEVRQILAGEAGLAVDSLDPEAEVRFVVDAGGAIGAIWYAEGVAFYATLAMDTEVQGQPLRYVRGVDESWMHNIALEPGCYQRSEESLLKRSCDFGEVALGLVTERALVASINTEACRQGQLRLGTFERGSGDVELRGPWRRSNSYLGIDLNAAGTCTGGSRPACQSDLSGCGALRPALAVIELNPVQALVGWIGDSQGRQVCGDDPAPVEVIGAYLQHAERGEEFFWINASGEGVPQRVGSTIGSGIPAIVAVGESAYLIAHGDADGALALHSSPRAPRPPEYDEFACGDCVDDRTGLETAPLEEGTDLGPIEPADLGGVDWVVLAQGAIRGQTLDVGVAWRESCGVGAEAVYFRRLRLGLTRGGVPSSLVEVGDPQRLSAPVQAGGRIGVPSLAYTGEPFVTTGFERSGAGPATDETDGGWVVVWAERSAGEPAVLLARRVLELDGVALDDEERIELNLDGSSAPVDSPPAAVTVDEGVLFYAYHDVAGDRIVRGRLSLTSP